MLFACYSSPLVAVVDSFPGLSTGPFQFGSVQCMGNETSLFDCMYNTSFQCPASSFAGVMCPGELTCSSHLMNIHIPCRGARHI